MREMKGNLTIIIIITFLIDSIIIITALINNNNINNNNNYISFPRNFRPDPRKILNPKLENLKSYDVIVPRVYGNNHPGIAINNIMVPALTVEVANYTFNLRIPQLSQHERRTMKDVNCLYHGEVLELVSRVTLRTCNGISGRVSIKDMDEFELMNIYEDESNPLHAEHALYRTSDYKEGHLYSCGTVESKNLRFKRENRKEISRIYNERITLKPQKRLKRNRKLPLREPYDSNTNTKYLELYVVNDHSQYVKFNRDYWQVVRRTKDIVNIINSIYRQIGIYIVLVGIEVWTEKDEIKMNGNSSETLQGFVEYKKKNISRRIKHDNVQLIVGTELGQGVIGKAPIRSMCSFESSAAVNEDRHDNVAAIATTIAHEMGHNFGLPHDLAHCVCPDNQCIMSSAGGGSDSYKYWSDCSKKKFDDLFEKGLDYCMRDLPEETYMGPTCGNGFKEGDEECDCGLEEDCDNPCCLASSCKLAENATCATGKCCNLETCQIRVEGTECRSSSAQCDLPEFCDGLQEFCPSDVFKQNGFPCKEGGEDSYCFDAKCQTHSSQCYKLWGHTSRVSEPLCFEHFNPMGKVHGHCGHNWLDRTFVQCAEQDVMCGMLHCEHQAKDLSFWFSTMTLTMPDTFLMKDERKIICKAAIMDVGFMPDPGQVAAGTKCGPDSMCLNSRCINISYLTFPRCPENCNNNGVCNSIGQCHCDKGWAPPFCKTRGKGGSAHSNSPGDKDLPTWTVVLICFICFMIIPAMLISAVLLWRKRKRVKEMSVKKWYQCYSSAGRSIGSCLKTSKSPKIITVAKNDACHILNTKTDLVRSNSSARKHSSNLTRISSFRPEDISKPLLQSSTNNNLLVSNQSNTGTSVTQAYKPQRPKLPAHLHPSYSFSHSDKQPKEQIYANQITRNISFEVASKKDNTNSNNQWKSKEEISEDNEGISPLVNAAFEENVCTKHECEITLTDTNHSIDVPKQKYENVDEISLNHNAMKKSQVNGISRITLQPSKSLSSNSDEKRISKESNKIATRNNKRNNISSEYGNLPVKSRSLKKSDKHSTPGLKPVSSTNEVIDVKITPEANKGKVSSLREKFQIDQKASDLQNLPVKPKSTHLNMKT